MLQSRLIGSGWVLLTHVSNSQVSHHPPISGVQADGAGWTWSQVNLHNRKQTNHIVSKLLVILEVELNRNLEGVLKYLTAAMKYSGFENSEQILGEINGVPAGGRGSCQIFYPQDLAHRMYRHFDIFIKNATSEINNNFYSILNS